MTRKKWRILAHELEFGVVLHVVLSSNMRLREARERVLAVALFTIHACYILPPIDQWIAPDALGIEVRRLLGQNDDLWPSAGPSVRTTGPGHVFAQLWTDIRELGGARDGFVKI